MCCTRTHDRRKSVISIHIYYLWSQKLKNTVISLFKEDPMPPQRRVKLVKCSQGSTTTTTSFPSYNTRISMNHYYCCSWSWSKRNETSKIKWLRNQLSNIWRIKYMVDQISKGLHCYSNESVLVQDLFQVVIWSLWWRTSWATQSAKCWSPTQWDDVKYTLIQTRTHRKQTNAKK